MIFERFEGLVGGFRVNLFLKILYFLFGTEGLHLISYHREFKNVRFPFDVLLHGVDLITEVDHLAVPLFHFVLDNPELNLDVKHFVLQIVVACLLLQIVIKGLFCQKGVLKVLNLKIVELSVV